eukprot:6422841-Alexandrium_andersonii.AAC.1
MILPFDVAGTPPALPGKTISASFGSKRVRRASSSWSSGKMRGPVGLNAGSWPGIGVLMSLGC